MMKEILFVIVVFMANIVEGITGFAGTMLAMPCLYAFDWCRRGKSCIKYSSNYCKFKYCSQKLEGDESKRGSKNYRIHVNWNSSRNLLVFCSSFWCVNENIWSIDYLRGNSWIGCKENEDF